MTRFSKLRASIRAFVKRADTMTDRPDRSTAEEIGNHVPYTPLILRKWYFAANRNALQDCFDQIEVAVKSARINTSLQPVCLIDDREDLSGFAPQFEWFERMGVEVILHRAELFPIVREHFGPAADPYNGHWLRCDIPLIESEQDFVLYTDIDVMFRGDVGVSHIRPEFLACAPEHFQNDLSYFNSGVMIMNLPALRQTRDDLIAVVKRRLPNMWAHDDQGAYNDLFRDRWARLPNAWNWKPYWGCSDDARILHFHGPKPGMVRRMSAGEKDAYGLEMMTIFERSPAGYEKYMKEFDSFLKIDVKTA